MPLARISIDSAILMEAGWNYLDDKSGIKYLWGIDRHGQWKKEAVDISTGPKERPVYIGTQGSFGVLTASSRITMRDGNIITAGNIAEQSRVGEIWFEMASDLPGDKEYNPGKCITEALTRCAPFHSSKKIAIIRCWPDGKKIPASLRPIVKTLKCGGSEYCVFDRVGLESLLSTDWENTFCDFSSYCFTNEDGYAEYDRRLGVLISWQIASLRKKATRFRLKFESLQTTRFVYFETVTDALSPVVRGGCACCGPAAIPTLELKWGVPSWSPVIGGFFLRGS